MSRGFLLNEIFRRADSKGRTIGEYLRDDVAGPLKACVHIGLDEDKAHETINRVAFLRRWSLSYVLFHTMLPDVLGSKIQLTTHGYLGALYGLYKVGYRYESV